MKKLILMVCTVAAFAALAAETGDSYLYWMVGDTITVDGTEYDWAKGNLTARVVAYNNDTGKSEYLNLYGQSSSGGLDPAPPATGFSQVTLDGMNSPFYAGIASSMAVANWSYFIELYNEALSSTVRSVDYLDYPTAQTMAFLKGSDLNPGKYWSVAAFTPKPVPEPNSALLLLIGCAALALRRRKQIAA